MLALDVVPKQTEHLIPTGLVYQTAFWGRVSRRIGHTAEAYDLAAPSRAVGDFLVVRTPLSDDVDCAYVPFGPELTPDTEHVGAFLERVSRQLRPLLGRRCAFVRWDLPWTSIHAREARDFTEAGMWAGPPGPHARELRMNFDTEDKNLWKAPRDLLPPDSVMVDLTASEETMLARMHHKTHYNVRLAARRGVEIIEGTVADLPGWYELYLETMARHHLTPLPLAHFRAMLEETGGSTVQTRLLLAKHGWRLIAGMILALAPPRATYLYGASSRERRHLMGSSALQWAAMRAAKARGCVDYDMLGGAPRHDATHPLAGVHRFKMGFGGRLVHREGCWDYPFDERVYKAWRRWEQTQLATRSIQMQ